MAGEEQVVLSLRSKTKMINTILGSKGSVSQTFVQGFKVPVTKVTAGPCVVTAIKNETRDGYWAIQIGYSVKKLKNTSKPLQGHLKATIKEDKAPRFLREIKVKKEPEVKVGDTISTSDIFHAGDIVSVTGVSKGKGFAGGVKRWGFHGGPRTHGQSDRERAPGSIGQTTTPGRVYKGKKMAGRMGGEQVTIKNLHVISINPETNEMEISGQIPGTPGGLITIKKIKSGSLKELEHEVVAQVVEGEAPTGEAEGEKKEETAQVPEGGTPNA
jgi:large subunit ribosomal protein L3